MQKSLRSEGSWFPTGATSGALNAFDGPEFGWSLFQLVLQQIDCRAAARPGDVVAALAFISGRIIQRSAFRDEPSSFRTEVSGNGAVFLRNDGVHHTLVAMTPGSLASTLIESALHSGARRLPQFSNVLNDAQEAMRRRCSVDLRGAILSAAPEDLAAQVQGDFDNLLFEASDRIALVRAVIQACGQAIGYQRNRFCPAAAAELGLSVALYAGWLDQRGNARHQQAQ